MAASAATPGASAGAGATPTPPSPALHERACELLNQWLWFVEAHLRARATPASA